MMSLNLLDADTGKLIVRLSVAGLMLFHGIAKIMHPGSLDFIAGMLSGFGLPAVLAYGVYIGEVVAPLMVIVGFKARIGGLIMAVNMLFALVLAHTGEFFSACQNMVAGRLSYRCFTCCLRLLWFFWVAAGRL